MARDGSGTYTIPTTFSTGTTIDAPATNSNNSDIGSEITNSLPRDGQAAMSGTLKFANGTEAAPSFCPSSDTDTGLYRIGANNLGLSCAGAKVLDISASGLDVTGAVTVSGVAVYKVGGTDVAVTDGGTGASTAAGAATALGVGTGDSPQFTAINLGHATDTTIARVSAGVISVEGSNVILASSVAAQSDMETASSTTLFVSPGRQHFHPGHPKAWGSADNAGAIESSYGVSSISDDGTGAITWTLSITLSGNPTVVHGLIVGSTRHCRVTARSTTTVATLTENPANGTASDVTKTYIGVFGDI